MWGDGGRFYWGSTAGGAAAGAGEAEAEGIVVVFAWISSSDQNLRRYIDLYASLGWRTLVCHADFITLFFPDKVVSLACRVLNELVKEIKIKQLPVVFASFSGGSVGCLYKVLQLLDGKCEGQLNQDEYHLVKDCVCGQIYDSSPVDFTSDTGTRFLLHPSVFKTSHKLPVVPWMVKAMASGLDAVFVSRFEAQNAEYWQTLYLSSNTGPFLILCSENDELAPYQIVSNFAQRLLELGAEVKLVKWKSSPHVAHYKHHPADYRAAVTELLGKSAALYYRRSQVALSGDRSCEAIEHACDIRNMPTSSNVSMAAASGLTDDFFVPNSMEYHVTGGASVQGGQRPGVLLDLQNPPGINVHGVLGQILYDACVPKNVEGWDIKPTMPGSGLNRFGRRHGHFNPIKCLRLRSRL